MGGVAVDLDGMIGDDMLVVCLRLGMPTDCPIAECLGVTFRYPMLIPGVGVVCRHHQCLVVPVHAASVSQKAVMNLLSILGLSDEFDEVGCDACLAHWLSQSLACQRTMRANLRLLEEYSPTMVVLASTGGPGHSLIIESRR